MPGEKSLWGEPDCIASKLGENIFNYLDSRAENARRHDENYGNLKSWFDYPSGDYWKAKPLFRQSTVFSPWKAVYCIWDTWALQRAETVSKSSQIEWEAFQEDTIRTDTGLEGINTYIQLFNKMLKDTYLIKIILRSWIYTLLKFIYRLHRLKNSNREI